MIHPKPPLKKTLSRICLLSLRICIPRTSLCPKGFELGAFAWATIGAFLVHFLSHFFGQEAPGLDVAWATIGAFLAHFLSHHWCTWAWCCLSHYWFLLGSFLEPLLVHLGLSCLSHYWCLLGSLLEPLLVHLGLMLLEPLLVPSWLIAWATIGAFFAQAAVGLQIAWATIGASFAQAAPGPGCALATKKDTQKDHKRVLAIIWHENSMQHLADKCMQKHVIGHKKHNYMQ